MFFKYIRIAILAAYFVNCIELAVAASKFSDLTQSIFHHSSQVITSPSGNPTSLIFGSSEVQFFIDIGTFEGLGSQYFNQTSCLIPQGFSSIQHVLIRTAHDLSNITNIRKAFKKNMMVLFELTAVDVSNSSGFYPAYSLHAPLIFGSSMSCSYIKGQGLSSTSVIINYANVSVAGAALALNNVNNLVIVDLTIDRNNASWWTPGYPCAIATNYPSLVVPSGQAATVLATSTCKQYYLKNPNGGANRAIQTIDVAQVRGAPITIPDMGRRKLRRRR